MSPETASDIPQADVGPEGAARLSTELHPEGRSHAERASDEVSRQRRYVPGRGWTKHMPRILSILFLVVGIVSLIGALVPPVRRGDAVFREVLAALVLDPTPNLAWAALMFILASALRKRKRAAWWLLVLIELASVITAAYEVATHQDASLPVLMGIASAVVLILLLVSRREFFAIVQRGSLWRAILTFLLGGAVAFGLGWLLVSLFPGTVPAGDQGLWVGNELLGSIGEANETGLEGAPPHWVGVLVGLMGAIVYIATAWVFFRPKSHDVMLAPEEEVEVRELLAEHGERDSLGYFATRRDKSAAFSQSGKATVTYRVLSGVSLASGDPIGDPEAWPGAIEQWLEEARHYAWSPAVMGASEEGAEAYVRAGLSALELGDEAIIEFKDFTLEGRHMRAVRQAVSRLERAGYTARVRRHADIDEDEMAEVIAAADRWRDTENERGFSMALGRLGDPADGRCVLVEAFNGDGELEALLSFSPWGERGISLDLMRRSRQAENGVMEFMVAQVVAAGPRIGVDRLSLNFAVMRSVFAEGEAIGAGPVIRATRAFLIFASRWWQLESLYRSNAKYDPDWKPRYIVYDSPGDLPRVAIAAAVAEGFVDPPSPRGWFQRKVKKESPLAAAAAGSPIELIAAAEAVRAAQLAEVEAAEREDPWAGLPEQERVRREKLQQMRDAGYDPYAHSFTRTHSIGPVRASHAGLEPDSRTGDVVTIAGRVVLNRVGGKLSFATVRDFTGDIQLMISLDGSGAGTLQRWKDEVDLGDHVGVTGEVITSRRGELSILVQEFRVTSKCLVPLPDKHKGLTDPEARVRQRYVDLIVNPESREILELRSTAVRSVRESLWRRGYLEVETPMLQAIHGGANARPFTTHINAYDMDLYLRIAPELYLKRLLVGGADRVFELNRNFRNEGADSTHNPEFTSLEMYDAYGNYDVMAELTRDIILEAAIAVYGRPVVRRPQPDGTFEEVDISGPWANITVHEGISSGLGEEVTPGTPLPELRRLADRAGVPYDPEWDAAQVTLELYEHLCEDRTEMPTFYRDFPTEVSPLTRRKPSDPRVAERWDLVAWGAEIGTAYTELIDPIDQRERLTQQSLLAAAGDSEAMEIDEDFLRALEYGMPPAGGQGMGIDRLVMLLTGRSIRETVLFPLVRPD